MTTRDAQARHRAEHARQIALFRYRLVQEAIDRELSTRQRGRLVRQIASEVHPGPSGRLVQVSRKSLDRWIRAWRAGGFEALLPAARHVDPRSNADALALAVALKKENPARTAVQIRQIMLRHGGWQVPHERTIQRHFRRLELDLDLTEAAEAAAAEANGAPKRVLSRFECERPNLMWVGDALHGPRIGPGQRKAILFCFLDDHSRKVTGGRFGFAEDTIRMAAALRTALQTHGVPDRLYLDNGSPFVDSWLLRGCATLGIKLIHSTPGRPEGRGKIERFFRTVRDQFLVEFDGPHGRKVTDLAELNRLFHAWLETVYHCRPHSETGTAPATRWAGAMPSPLPIPETATLAEAFKWEEFRTVDKTCLVSFAGNYYQVDPHLRRRRVQLIFDPFNLAEIEVRHGGRSYGTAKVFELTRHAHPKARPEQSDRPQPEPTGLDYLGLLDSARTADLARSIDYAALFTTDTGHEGQVA
jgi:putative transposase